jgi:hypothetical protein
MAFNFISMISQELEFVSKDNLLNRCYTVFAT